VGRNRLRRKQEEEAPIIYDPLRDYEGGQVELFLLKSARFLRNHIKEILLLCLGLIVAGAGTIVYFMYLESQEEKALLAWEELQKNPAMRAGSGDTVIQKLKEYEQNFSLDSARNRSSLKRLAIFEKDKKHKEAAALARTFVAEVDEPLLKSYFHLRSAINYEETSDFSEAVLQYKAAAELITEDNYIKAFALFGHGRCLIASGKKDEGREVIKKLLDMKEASVRDIRVSAASFLLQNP